MKIDIIKQVAALPDMAMADLKKKWTALHSATEPPPFNRLFLVKRLAHRIQELSLGRVEERVDRRMERLADDGDTPPEKKVIQGDRLLTGTRLIREWKGVEYCCIVLDDGFECQGRKFGSLSSVANFITGTKWNGRVFWGLKKQGEKA